ncbi:MAG: dTDP-4-dehydrorhamnose reductase [Candidatus Omnitrophica bacterium]|nr:dTDP-4-dehydrorhamnose reductase [Candidatus Omnitrophota bacterium]
MKILITGAGGMLGSDLAEAFRSNFVTVGVVRRPVDYLSIPFCVRDLTRRQETLEIMSRESPQIIFHSAAMTDVDGCEVHRHNALQNNLEATKNVVEAANQIGSLTVFFSTDYVFDGKKPGEYDEADEGHPLNVYGETKWLAENYIRQKAKRFIIFRTSWLYGLRGKSFPKTILELSSSQKTLSVVTDQKGRPTYTRDIGKAFVDLLGKDPASLEKVENETFHLAGSSAVTWADFARGILRLAKHEDVEVQNVTSDFFKRPAQRPENSVLSVKKVFQKLNLKLRGWEEAIPNFIEELKGKGVYVP